MLPPEDLNRIRDTYADMQDDELLYFARKDGQKLAPEAFLILRDELRQRRIGEDLLKEMEHEIILQDSLKRQQMALDLKLNSLKDAIEYALKQKEEGTTNYDIYVGLIQLGLSEPNAKSLLNNLDQVVREGHQDAIRDVQAGVALFAVGLIAFYVTVQIGQFQFPAAIWALVAVIKTFIAIHRKNRMQNLQTVLKKEEEQARFN